MLVSLKSALDLFFAVGFVWAIYSDIVKLNVFQDPSLFLSGTDDGIQARSQVGAMIITWCIFVYIAFATAFGLRVCARRLRGD